MNYTALVGVLERLSHFDEDRNDLEVSRTAQLAQVAAGGELHWQSYHVTGALRWVHLEDARMIQPTGDLVLVRQGGPRRFAFRRRRRYDF